MMMKWTIEYKKRNGEEKHSETYEHVTVLGEYCNSAGLLVSVPERKSEKDSGIRRFSYWGIESMRLA